MQVVYIGFIYFTWVGDSIHCFRYTRNHNNLHNY